MKRAEGIAIETKLAPSVEKKWAEAFVLELRAEGVSGSAIGDALTEVEHYVKDSGDTAESTFGDPIAYARALKLPVDPRQSPTAIARYVSTIVLQVMGMFIVLLAFPWNNQPISVSLGNLVAAVVILLAMAGLTWFLVRSMNVFIQHTVISSLISALYAALIVGAAIAAHYLWAAVIAFTVPRLLTCAIGVALISAGVAAGVAIQRYDGADAITAPLESAEPNRRIEWASALMIPIGTVILAAAVQLFA
jgi:hypothetical protein